MKRITLLFIVTLLAGAGWATSPEKALAPKITTSLADHLMEVNAQWKNKDLSGELFQHKTAFEDEADRIRTHLLLVSEYLSQNLPGNLTPAQATNRKSLLKKLKRYAMEGKFPVNSRHQQRVPYFIDRYDNACAVGYLMQQSGANREASSIHKKMNNRYIKDMPRKELLAWARPHGFTLDELKWIQPGYPPATQWTSPGGGTDGPVSGIVKMGDEGDYLLFGDFSEAGNAPCDKAAIWNGEEFTCPGQGLDGTPRDGVYWNGQVILGGDFQNSSASIAVWNPDSSTWQYYMGITGEPGGITRLTILNGDLYATGYMYGAVGIDYGVVKIIAPDFNLEPAGGFNAPVNALTWHDGKLIAGGEFTLIEQQQVPASHLAQYDGEAWSEYAGGTEGSVLALHSMGDKLIAGGYISPQNPDTAVGLSIYQGGQWQETTPLFTDESEKVSGFEQMGEDLLVFGAYHYSPLNGILGSGLCSLDTMYLQLSGLMLANDEVKDVITFDNQIICGGSFTGEENGDSLSYLASADATSGNAEVEYQPIEVYPNPARQYVNVKMNDLTADRITVYSLEGKKLADEHISGNTSLRLDVSNLAVGSYIVTVQKAGAIRAVRTVVIER